MEKPLKKQQKISTKLKDEDKDEYNAIQNTIQINEKVTKKILQQRKSKKYNDLKHYPKPVAKATEDNENWVQPSNAQVTARAPLETPSLTNTNSKPNNKNIHERLRSSSPSNLFRKQGISI